MFAKGTLLTPACVVPLAHAVNVLFRIRLRFALLHTGVGDTGVSKHFVARWERVRLGGTSLRLAVVAVHFKAFPTDPRSCAQREAQAALVRREVAALAAAGARPAPPLQRVPCQSDFLSCLILFC